MGFGVGFFIFGVLDFWRVGHWKIFRTFPWNFGDILDDFWVLGDILDLEGHSEILKPF